MSEAFSDLQLLVRWRGDRLGQRTAAIGRRGQRIRLLQREPRRTFYLAIWSGSAGYRLRSPRTSDRLV